VDGQSLDEIVYWPALPASVSEELAKLKAIEADPQKLAAFQAKLPSGFVTGSIVIHHTNEGGQEVLAGSAREEGGKRPLESYRNPSYEQKSRRADPFGSNRRSNRWRCNRSNEVIQVSALGRSSTRDEGNDFLP
jgi:hypothetical protein